MTTRSHAVNLYISNDCVVREINCKSIVDTTMGTTLASLHSTSGMDYTKPNGWLCWHCATGFDTPPIPLPQSFDARTGKFTVEGNFCSFACARGYIAERCPYNAGHKQLLLKQIALRYYGENVDSIVAAPPHVALKAFGGNMDIDEFRACKSQVRVESPPFVPQKQLVQMQSGESSKTGWSVFNLRRAAPEPPAIVEGGDRGLYFDYLKKSEQDGAESSANPAPPPPRSSSRKSALQQFMK